MLVVGAALLLGVLLERPRYSADRAAPPPGATTLRPTDKVFVDPTTGRRIRVWIDPSSGARDYRPEGE